MDGHDDGRRRQQREPTTATEGDGEATEFRWPTTVGLISPGCQGILVFQWEFWLFCERECEIQHLLASKPPRKPPRKPWTP